MYKSFIIWSVLLYGCFVLSFGILGYVRAGSAISLFSGLILGAILCVSSLLLALKKKLGGILAFAASLILTFTFSIRYALTSKIVLGALAVLSAMTLLFFLIQLYLKGTFSRKEEFPKEK